MISIEERASPLDAGGWGSGMTQAWSWEARDWSGELVDGVSADGNGFGSQRTWHGSGDGGVQVRA